VIGESDQLIRTFNALLMISRVEAGQAPAEMSAIDISGIARDSAELYEPVAEDGGLRLVTEIATGVSIPRELEVGEGLHLIHAANIRIHPSAVIGERVGIMHDVTIGTGLDEPGAPVIGDDVFIGAGAKIVGPVRIGAGARIAANSLVVSDVPPGATAIGVPARAVPPMRNRRAA
jgi:acetyltransferase-like isoleucine patch superfamily enzyme